MMTPSLFNDNFDLFDRFYQDPWFGFDDHDFKNLEKKLLKKGEKEKDLKCIKHLQKQCHYIIPGFQILTKIII